MDISERLPGCNDMVVRLTGARHLGVMELQFNTNGPVPRPAIARIKQDGHPHRIEGCLFPASLVLVDNGRGVLLLDDGTGNIGFVHRYTPPKDQPMARFAGPREMLEQIADPQEVFNRFVDGRFVNDYERVWRFAAVNPPPIQMHFYFDPTQRS